MTMNDRIAVIIADDHPIVRRGIRDTIAEHGRFTVVAEIGHGERVLDAVRLHRPALLLLDLNMPGAHGLDIIKAIKAEAIDVLIIVMTMHREEEIVDAVRELGVKGYLLKESAEENLVRCMEHILAGEYYLSPELSSYLVQRVQRVESALRGTPGLGTLTPSERHVLRLIAQQLTSREVADLLHISVHTVHNHRNNICQKLDLHGANALLKFAIEHSALF